MSNSTLHRGCGTRKENSLYLCVDESLHGLPITSFQVDPAVEYTGGYFRTPIVTPPDRNGIKHVVLWIGKVHYPFVPDYVEEALRYGISKKVPINSDFSELTPGLSQLMLVHPRAIPQFGYKLQSGYCPMHLQTPHQCIGDLWDLSSVESSAKHTLTPIEGSNTIRVDTPSVMYPIFQALNIRGDPLKILGEYKPGVILRFPRFHFNYINQDGKAPPTVTNLRDQGFKMEVVKK